ncbi:type II secretion system protein [Aminivibrio sp.]|uniref:type II secretion system protein n=1 Tax=Aminivibrio sp. TaxID=1872489 RepID=UPI001A52ECF5|nr:prepilin-type N-terminal cleavage/methylation domain-containing protein [Aminivibrio sp.]MBL3539149.1 prepilin-type N-terminal cleavage/methylation domain-containing protein [Aminivibrio sp.]
MAENAWKKKGFTLVELLIVIIIVGILTSTMLLLMNNAEDKAEATVILSDMRSMKSAMVIFKLEKGRWPERTSDDAEIQRLFGGASLENFSLMSSGDEYAFIRYDLSNNKGKSPGVKKKLALMADSSGLLKEGTSVPPATPVSYTEEGTKVEMKVR